MSRGQSLEGVGNFDVRSILGIDPAGIQALINQAASAFNTAISTAQTTPTGFGGSIDLSGLLGLLDGIAGDASASIPELVGAADPAVGSLQRPPPEAGPDGRPRTGGASTGPTGGIVGDNAGGVTFDDLVSSNTGVFGTGRGAADPATGGVTFEDILAGRIRVPPEGE